MNPKYPDALKSIDRLIDKANIILLYLDPELNISVCNTKAQEITAKPADRLIGKNWLDILGSDSSAAIKQQMFKAVLKDASANKRPSIFEGSIIGPDRKELVISWNITPLEAESGEIEGILLLGSDVTLLKEREASLKKIDDTLKNILSSIKEYALYAVNLEGKITYIGMGFESMFGWDKHEIIFKHASLLYTPDDAVNRLKAALEQVKLNGNYELELYLLKKNGQSFPVILNVSRFLDSNANLIGYIFIAKDITEQKKLEYQIFQSEKMSAIGKLSAGMAHEINNPLLVISGRLKMLLEDNKTGRPIKKELKVIDKEAERIRNLVKRFLSFTRKEQPKITELDINKVIKNVLPLLTYHKFPSHKVRVAKVFYKGLPPIKGDSHQLQEVLINLFVNAYQAMPKGGLLTIKTFDARDGFAQICISDTGEGIAPENLKNLFLPFFSTKKEGTGLGLSICYNIIKNLGGTIDVESQLGKGTTFTIKLPFKKEAKDAG